jgi:hypothetical protein
VFTRYAVFHTLTPSPLADFGAAWLGWDVARGVTVDHPKINGLDIENITDVPRKYGVHGTIKPPFVLADGTTETVLADALEILCQNTRSVTLDQLELVTLGRFLALCPMGNTDPLRDLAAKVVRDLDGFRAPMAADEFARKTTGHLTPSQTRNLQTWGYPHVMDAFKFHITLTGKLNKRLVSEAKLTLDPLIKPMLAKPFFIDSLTLVGQRSDGMFEQITRYPLAP